MDTDIIVVSAKAYIQALNCTTGLMREDRENEVVSGELVIVAG